MDNGQRPNPSDGKGEEMRANYEGRNRQQLSKPNTCDTLWQHRIQQNTKYNNYAAAVCCSRFKIVETRAQMPDKKK